MNKIPVITEREFYELLIKYGCKPISIKGSHFKVVNPTNGNVSPIPIHAKKDINRGFMKSILNQLGIDIDNFVETMF